MRLLGWRWAVVVGLCLTLAALPALAAALPARDSQEGTDAQDAAGLLTQVRRSAVVGWSGYGESRGSLVLPDVSQLADLPALVGGTQRTRVWWRAAQDWRVDVLSLVGETDLLQDANGSWTWMSADRRATRIDGPLPVRLPTAADLVAPTLGRRLAGAAELTASRIGARRVAGRITAGIRLTPDRPGATTVQAVDLWVDRASGLALEVAVHAGGRIVLDALLLDLRLGDPGARRTVFLPPADAQYTEVQAPDLVAQADRFAPFILPPTLAGAARTDQVAALRPVAGVGTYGAGLASFAVVPLPRRLAGEVLGRLVPGPRGDERLALGTPLLNALVGRSVESAGGGYLLVGTVPAGVLTAALDQLLADPPRLFTEPGLAGVAP